MPHRKGRYPFDRADPIRQGLGHVLQAPWAVFSSVVANRQATKNLEFRSTPTDSCILPSTVSASTMSMCRKVPGSG